MKGLIKLFSGSLSIRILFGLLLSLVPMLMIVVISYYSARDISTNNSKLIMKLIVEGGAKDTNDFLKEQESRFARWTGEDVFGMAIEFETTAELKDHFQSLLKGQNAFTLLALTDVKGKILEAASIVDSKEQPADNIKGQNVQEAAGLDTMLDRSAVFVSSDFMKELGHKTPYSYSRQKIQKENQMGPLLPIWTGQRFSIMFNR